MEPNIEAASMLTPLTSSAAYDPSSPSSSPSQPSRGSPSSAKLPHAVASFIAGACAGLVVDVGLFPIDTVKTRIQSVGGFRANGAFRDIYKGVGVVMMGSVPGGAVFFATYDSVCRKLLRRIERGLRTDNTVASGSSTSSSSTSSSSSSASSSLPSATHLGVRVLGGSVAECAACSVRVPVELFKQRLQIGLAKDFKGVWNGVVSEAAERYGSQARTKATTTTKYVSPSAIARVLYKGYPITIFREVPFAMIQMPLYETLKVVFSGGSGGVAATSETGNAQKSGSNRLSFLKGIAPGFISGGISAVLTTPLDVTKTRIMTATTTINDSAANSGRMRQPPVGAVRLAADAMAAIVKNEGAKALFKGGMTRGIWISSGGALFFGTYEGVKAALV